MHGVAQPELPAHHHGLSGGPACAAHRAPPGPNLNLHPALVTAPTAYYPNLQKTPCWESVVVEGGGDFLSRL